ncbi:tRNA threonylcarbamoyladenosine dehydratase, partial [Ruminococcaceae bacterium OttesenSCG-928-A16]|nr:tRNA threonylcarbamoyladenosine dehydratase [Ruminococcaceae bacterium OttesenSCG-928-A16]
MSELFARTEMLVGEDAVALLAAKRVAVFGVGGVGGFVCEALARAGIGQLDIFDDDVVSISNLNRQIVALQSTVGRRKTSVMAQRIADINPACVVTEHAVFYTPQNADDYPLGVYDYIVDAVDTVSAKLEIITRAVAAGVPVISAMGAGNKLHPELFEVADIEKTSVCPLARVIRKELKKRNIHGVKVVYSKEEPLTPLPLP